MIRLRSILQRRGRTILVGGALALTFIAVAWAHGAPGAEHMGSGSDDMRAAVTICLAVVSTGLGLLTVVSGLIVLRRRRPPTWLAPTAPISFLRAPLATPARARAGPAMLQVCLR
jgi:hypothetical protein